MSNYIQAIRFLRYRKHLSPRLREETSILLKQKGDLAGQIVALQNMKKSLVSELGSLTKNKQTLEASITAIKNYPQEALAQKLINLKQQQPTLFYMSGQDQINQLVSTVIKGVFS